MEIDSLRAFRLGIQCIIDQQSIQTMPSYLTEASMKSIIELVFPGKEIISQFKFEGSRFRYDYKVENTLVEFDGFLHYTKSIQQKRDKAKDELAKENGYNLVRWPYFIQPTTETILHYFRKHVDYAQVYEHGFIDKEVVLPADFNMKGVNLFVSQWYGLPPRTSNAVLDSLITKAKELGKSLVIDDDTFDRLA